MRPSVGTAPLDLAVPASPLARRAAAPVPKRRIKYRILVILVEIGHRFEVSSKKGAKTGFKWRQAVSSPGQGLRGRARPDWQE